MADGEGYAYLLGTRSPILESTVARTAAPPLRYLLPRASGFAVLPALPSLPSCPPFVLDGGIRAKWADCADLRRWRQWVDKLRPLHEALWRELGILEGILATTYRVQRGSDGGAALLQLVPFWSPRTNTFVFPWGEATVTLEDVAALAGLPLLGLPVRKPLYDDKDLEAEQALESVCCVLLTKQRQGTGRGWVEHWLDQQEAAAAGGRDEQKQLLEHGAFLAYWLARFVLPAAPSGPDGGDIVPGDDVLPIAVRLARGRRVALAPAALASIYSGLSALQRHFVFSKRTEALPVSAPMRILQLWVWERFPQLRPATASTPDPADPDVPRAARWHDAHKALHPGYVRAVLMAPGEFKWRSYGSSYWVRGGHGHGAAAGTRALRLSFERCLRACELVGVKDVERYNPHRVARQLGFDQDVPRTVTRLSTNLWENAWETYNTAEVKDYAIPSDQPGVTDKYAEWWNGYATAMDVDEGNNMDPVHEEMFDGLSIR